MEPITNETIKRSSDETISETTQRSSNEITGKSSNETISETTQRSSNEITGKSSNEITERSADETSNDTTKRSLDKTTNEITERSSNETIKGPLDVVEIPSTFSATSSLLEQSEKTNRFKNSFRINSSNLNSNKKSSQYRYSTFLDPKSNNSLCDYQTVNHHYLNRHSYQNPSKSISIFGSIGSRSGLYELSNLRSSFNAISIQTFKILNEPIPFIDEIDDEVNHQVIGEIHNEINVDEAIYKKNKKTVTKIKLDEHPSCNLELDEYKVKNHNVNFVDSVDLKSTHNKNPKDAFFCLKDLRDLSMSTDSSISEYSKFRIFGLIFLYSLLFICIGLIFCLLFADL